MKINRLGRTGLKVSEICLGTMTFGAQADESAAFSIMDRAAAGGVNFIDTADVYPVPVAPETVGRTEEIVGNWLRGKRDAFVLATKCRARMGSLPWQEGLSRKHIVEALEASLRRLQTDYIDLYQAHSPDPDTPIDETLGAFDDMVRSGKVRYIGCSNYGAWKLAQALWTSSRLGIARYDCLQPRYNILFRQIEDEVLPLCREEGVGVIAYNPLAGGFLSGKYSTGAEAGPGTRFDILKGKTSLYHDRYWQEAQFAAVEGLKRFTDGRGEKLATAAVAWVLTRPGVTSAIVGASRAEQMEDTLAACEYTVTPELCEAADDVWFSLPRPRDASIALR